ncbi:MAG: PEP-CTERM sorting domain-containing protein [Thiobacillaceae bacterium]
MLRKKSILAHRAASLAAMAVTAFASAHAQAVVTTYNVTETFNQVVYNTSHPDWDTIFTGSFTFDSDTMTVSGLTGSLSQAMTGNTAFRPLNYQLSSVFDSALGGLLVSAFYQNSTDVFQGGGFATGGSKEFGNQNAYATIFVNTTDPTAALTQAQINKLAYGDCTTGSLMGSMSPKMCMTGWVKDTAGVLSAGGTMSGTFPIAQSITAVPEPETYGMMMAGLGLVGFAVRKRLAS